MRFLATLDATAQAELVRSGQASPTELVDAAIERIERLDPDVNAVVHRRFEKARAEAASPDLPNGPFRGVPILVKDLLLTTEGDPITCGSAFLRDAGYVAPEDSFLATKLREAGFVIVGRAATPEFGLTITTEPLAFGPTRNPWNLERSTGGSSGGSAAAVAAGMVPVAHGGDGGGSIRIPASECGIVGLKPSRGRLSCGPDESEIWGGSVVEGALTRTVRDTAAMLDVLGGVFPGDPYVAPGFGRLVDHVGADPGKLRIGFRTATLPGMVEAHPDCIAAVESAAALLESLGHEVSEASVPAFEEVEFATHFANMIMAWTARELDLWGAKVGRPVTAADVESTTWLYAEMGRAQTAPAYLMSMTWLGQWTRRVAQWWADGNDLLLTPTLAAPPPPLGELVPDPENPVMTLVRVTNLMAYTPAFNATGQPAISLPLHTGSDGLPIGVQLAAAYGREDLLVRIASQIERAAPWAERRPPLHAENLS